MLIIIHAKEKRGIKLNYLPQGPQGTGENLKK
jgi:hypothetical protein